MAHPEGSTRAVTTLATGHNLLSNNPVTHFDSPALSSFVVEYFNDTDEFVTGNYISFDVGWTIFVTPKLRGALITFHVAGAYANCFYADECLSSSRLRNCYLFECVVLWAVAYNCGGDGGHGLASFFV